MAQWHGGQKPYGQNYMNFDANGRMMPPNGFPAYGATTAAPPLQNPLQNFSQYQRSPQGYSFPGASPTQNMHHHLQPMIPTSSTMSRSSSGNNMPVQLKPAAPPSVDKSSRSDKQNSEAAHAKNGTQGAPPPVSRSAPSGMTSFKIKTAAVANSRWGREPDKAKELQQSVQNSENKKNQQLQKTIAEFKSRSELAEKREKSMSVKLQSTIGEVDQLKLDFDMLKAEVIHAHQELEIVADENAKLKALGTQSEKALLQAAVALKKYETSRAKEVNKHQGERVVHLSELSVVQTELDLVKPQMAAAKSALGSVRLELKSKESQLKDTMAFNKKSMAITAKLNDCVKLQEKELSDLKWTKGMLENEMKEKTLKIGALQALQDSRQAAAPPAPPKQLTEEMSAKESEIQRLTKSLEESQQQIISMKQMRKREIQIPWNAAKLGATAKEYLSQLSGSKGGVKRKLAEAIEDSADGTATKLSKHAVRSVMMTDADLEKEMNNAMSSQQATVARVQRSLLHSQKALRDAQEELDANCTRKRCLEARSKVLREQQNLIAKFMGEIKDACHASEQTVAPLTEAVTRLTADLAAKRAALIETQLTGSELDLEKRNRTDSNG